MRKNLLTVFFLSVFCTGLFGQFNFRAGYYGTWNDMEATDQILKAFNQQTAGLTDEFSTPKYMQGVTIGGRQRWGSFAVHSFYFLQFKNVNATGRDSMDNDFSQELSFRRSGFALGVEGFLGELISVGTQLEGERFRIRDGIVDDDITRQRRLYATAFFTVHTPNQGSFSLGLQPFVRFPLGQYDLRPLAQRLGVDGQVSNTIEESMYYGINIIFYNGR